MPILEKGRERAESANDRTKFDLALAACYQSLKKYEELLTVGRRLLTAYPESPTAFATTVQALRELKRWDELDKAFAERLKSVPDDDTTLPLALTIALARGDGANGIQIGEKIVATGKADSGGLQQSRVELSRERCRHR